MHNLTGGREGGSPPGPSAAPAPGRDGSRLTADADRLRTVMTRLRRELHRVDSPGLSPVLYSALATAATRDEMSIGELADREHLPASAATRIIDRLEEAGLVERRANPRDRRGVNLALTPEGRHVLAERRRSVNAWLARRLARLTAEQWSVVSTALDLLEGVALRDLETWELPDAPPSAQPAATPSPAGHVR